MKNFIKLTMVAIILVTVSLSLVGCNKDEGLKIMNLDLHYKLQFLLDRDNNVINCVSLNDESNALVSEVNFEGLNLNQAVDAFLNAPYDGEACDQPLVLTISVSGDSANKIFEKVSKISRGYFEDNNIDYLITLERLSKVYLEKLVIEYNPTLTISDVNKKTENELLVMLENVLLT